MTPFEFELFDSRVWLPISVQLHTFLFYPFRYIIR